MGQGHRISKWQRLLGRGAQPAAVIAMHAAAPRPGVSAPDDGADTEPGDFAASSIDLLRGTDITEYPDTVTDALLDELFHSAPTDRTRAP